MYLFPLKRPLVVGLFFAIALVAQATEDEYINSGAVTNEIVDAYKFRNEGYFETTDPYFSGLPYETLNTTNYVNAGGGTMMGSPGYRFHTYLSNGTRKRAVLFHNIGSIDVVDDFIFFGLSFGNLFNSYVFVDSTNIINSGSISVGGSGLLRMDGNNINLRDGVLQATDLISEGGFFYSSLDSIFQTNFLNESKVSDYYWGVGTNNAVGGNGNPFDLGSGRFDTNSANFGSGNHQVLNYFGSTNTTRVPAFGSSGTTFRPFTYVTQLSPSNRVIQVVFVSTNALDPMNVDVRFAPNDSADQGSQVIVQFSVNDTDAITGDPVTRSLYFSDNTFYATYGTNQLFYQNEVSTVTYRPNPYDVTFYTPIEWAFGDIQNTAYSPSLLYNANYSRFVTNLYAGYAAYVGNSVNTNLISGDELTLDPTNSLGRIEIFAKTLDINKARMRSEGLLSIKADNFLAVTNGARLDAQELNLNLTSTNQTFIISNVLSGTVKRIGGRLNAYSCVWSNKTTTGDEDRFHVLFLENLLTSVQPSTSYGFIVRVTNQPNSSIILEDDITVARDFYVDAENVTVRGSLNLPANIGYTNLPRVINFTNEGVISVPSSANFRRQTQPYSTFVNTNLITAGAQAISSTYFANSGLLQATVGSLSITNNSGVANLTNGLLMSRSDFRLFTTNVQASNSVIMAGAVTTNFLGQTTFSPGSISLTVGLGFVDGGSNLWQSFNGVNLFKSAPGSWQGDLLATKIVSYARPFSTTPHTWTAADYGADRSGYSNNAAVGWLKLDGYNSGSFVFSGPVPEGQSAIYVDYLELKNNATNYTTALGVGPNFKIYFANANLPPSKLDGALGGCLRWVQNYAGQYSSTNIVLADGRTITVNRALVESSEIDSDADGTPNQFDTYPFDGPIISSTVTNLPPLTTVLSWNGAANTTYTVDFTTNLVSWQILTNVITGGSAGAVTASDPVPPDGPRFYRVRYSP